MDTDSWEKREKRFKKKFDLGKKHIPNIFEDIQVPKEIDQMAVFFLRVIKTIKRLVEEK